MIGIQIAILSIDIIDFFNTRKEEQNEKQSCQ